MTRNKLIKFLATAAMLALAALAAAACGGSGKAATGSPGPPTTANGRPATVGVENNNKLGKILDDTITGADFKDDAVTTAKILDLNVTTAKIANAGHCSAYPRFWAEWVVSDRCHCHSPSRSITSVATSAKTCQASHLGVSSRRMSSR